MTKCSRLGLATAIALAVASPAAAQSRPLPGADAFAPPGGRYAVGMRELLWVNGGRRLTVRVWYPAQSPAAGPVPWSARAPYIRGLDEFGGAERQRALPYSLVRPFAMRVRSHSLPDAPPAIREPRFPLLVYTPGAGQTRYSATFLTEQLASHGYVVVAANHPAPGDDFPAWVASAWFMLDQLEALDRTPAQPFFQRLDLNRVGMLGWSLGGATSIQMSKDDPRVKAAVDHDGTLFGGVRETGTPRPVMVMHNGADGRFDAFFDRSTGDWHEVEIAGTDHFHFSDQPLFSTTNPPENLFRVHEVIVAYTLAFFDRYLLGRESELLAGPSADYPEVTFRKK